MNEPLASTPKPKRSTSWRYVVIACVCLSPLAYFGVRFFLRAWDEVKLARIAATKTRALIQEGHCADVWINADPSFRSRGPQAFAPICEKIPARLGVPTSTSLRRWNVNYTTKAGELVYFVEHVTYTRGEADEELLFTKKGLDELRLTGYRVASPLLAE